MRIVELNKSNSPGKNEEIQINRKDMANMKRCQILLLDVVQAIIQASGINDKTIKLSQMDFFDIFLQYNICEEVRKRFLFSLFL